MKKIFVLSLLTAAILVGATNAQAEQTKNIMFVFDASGSMLESFGPVSRIEAAKSALSDLLSNLEQSILVAFRPYAHIRKEIKSDACKITELMAPFGGNRTDIINKANSLQAVGAYTPIAYALLQAKNDFTAGNDNVLILLSDGKENCGGDPVAAAKSLLESDKKIKAHVIGLGVDAESRQQLSAIAAAGNGKYYDATDGASLIQSFKAIQELEKPINKTNTDAILGTAIRGGNGFDTAVEIQPGKYHLDHHQINGQFDYFKIQTQKGVPITFKTIAGEIGIRFNEKTGLFEESKDILPVIAGFKLMDSDRSYIAQESTRSPLEKSEYTYKPTESSFIYLLVGFPGGTIGSAQTPPAMNKNTLFAIEKEGFPLDSNTPTSPGTPTAPTNQLGSQENNQNNQPGQTNKLNTIYLYGGIGLIILIILILLIMVIIKVWKKKGPPPTVPPSFPQP